jgi:outer membrane immunogenic protein
MRNSKSIISAVVAISAVVGIGAASAADLPARSFTKAPVMPVEVYNWTGFYIGGSVGGKWSQSTWTTDVFDGLTPPDPTVNGQKLNATSARVSAIAGYDWQFSQSGVLGIEGDIAWAQNNKTIGGFPGDPFFAPFSSTFAADQVTTKLGWDGSIRGRLGWLVAPNVMLYGTGGVAFQQIQTSAFCNSALGPSYCGGVFSDSASTVKAGWTAGGGVEAMLTHNWAIRGEYRYADFGNVTNVFPPAANTGFSAHVHVTTNIALVGLTYKFGGPVVAKY